MQASVGCMLKERTGLAADTRSAARIANKRNVTGKRRFLRED